MRSPEQIKDSFRCAVLGLSDVDPAEVVAEIIDDILDTLRIVAPDALAEVTDYVVNHYGDL